MNSTLLRLLEPITEEEKKILQGFSGIEKENYTTGKEFTIDSKKMLKRGKLIDIRTHTRFVAFPKHKHNYIEIIYMCTGQTRHMINGVTEVLLEKGDLLFLNQHSSHEILPAGREDIAVNFVVLPEFFDVAFDMLEEENVLSNFIISALRRDDNASYLHFKVADVLPVQNLVENLVWGVLHKQRNDSQINRITMGLLFAQLINCTDKLEESDPDQYKNLLAMKAVKYIEENYRLASLEELAASLNQSVSNLSKIIKAGTGYTFKELLQQKRLNQSVGLLCHSALPVTDIIYAVGYDNTSYFHRIFKQKYGISPKEYRNQFGK